MAHRAGGLEAVMIGVAPPFALIVKNAAGVEAEIAANRAHIALGRPGDMRRCLRHRGIVPHHAGMRGDLGQRCCRADRKLARVRRDRAQFFDSVDLDQHRRRDDAAADIHQKVGAAAKQT